MAFRGRIVPELTPGDAEPLVEKSSGDAFEDTTLESALAGPGSRATAVRLKASS